MVLKSSQYIRLARISGKQSRFMHGMASVKSENLVVNHIIGWSRIEVGIVTLLLKTE